MLHPERFSVSDEPRHRQQGWGYCSNSRGMLADICWSRKSILVRLRIATTDVKSLIVLSNMSRV